MVTVLEKENACHKRALREHDRAASARHEKIPAYVDGEDLVEFFHGKSFRCMAKVNSRSVEQHVNPPEAFLDGLHAAFDLCCIRNVTDFIVQATGFVARIRFGH